MKSFLFCLGFAAAAPSVAQAGNICDAEAVVCAKAHTNFMCGSASVMSSDSASPNKYDVTVAVGCGEGTQYVSVQVEFDGLACTCTRVTAPGDGG